MPHHSGLCAGWGWGLASYTRNIQIENNSITKVMQLLSDGGGVYTNTPCAGCHVSRNYFADDPHVYGCLYHGKAHAYMIHIHDDTHTHAHTRTHTHAHACSSLSGAAQ